MSLVLVQMLRLNRRQVGVLYKCDTLTKRGAKKQATQQAKLAEVGHLDEVKHDGKYATGQLFLHRIFGYRGVILFPWTARVYDRDLNNPNKVQVQTGSLKSAKIDGANKDVPPTIKSAAPCTVSSTDKSKTANQIESADAQVTPVNTTAVPPPPASNEPKEVKGKVHNFYQVLIDSRDSPHVRAQTEAVTFLGNQSDTTRSLYAIPGLDYVSHEDVMPYSSADKSPLQHELFDKFLSYAPDKSPPFVAQDTLIAWQEKNHPWLDMSDVHKETTENIRVTVIPFYMGSRETPVTSVYWWRYCIRLENLGDMSVQLRERHWRIFSLSGTLETVRGRGVVGQEPILSPRQPAFQYSSHVSLQAPSGHMWGTFRLEREDGYTFDCKIPPFSLESKPDEMNPKGGSGAAPPRNNSGSPTPPPPPHHNDDDESRR